MDANPIMYAIFLETQICYVQCANLEHRNYGNVLNVEKYHVDILCGNVRNAKNVSKDVNFLNLDGRRKKTNDLPC